MMKVRGRDFVAKANGSVPFRKLQKTQKQACF